MISVDAAARVTLEEAIRSIPVLLLSQMALLVRRGGSEREFAELFDHATLVFFYPESDCYRAGSSEPCTDFGDISKRCAADNSIVGCFAFYGAEFTSSAAIIGVLSLGSFTKAWMLPFHFNHGIQWIGDVEDLPFDQIDDRLRSELAYLGQQSVPEPRPVESDAPSDSDPTKRWLH